MKALFRILVITTILTFVFYKYSQNTPAPPAKPDESASYEEWQEYASEALPRPNKGISTLIGKPALEVAVQYGEPVRKDLASDGLEWWVYNKDITTFMMVAVVDEVVKQVYVAGRDVKTTPFTIGSTLDDVYRTSIVEPEVMLNKDDQLYTLALSDYDLRHRLLIKFDDIVAQVFINANQAVTAIRFYDYDTIIKTAPYEMAYYDGATSVNEQDIVPTEAVARGIEQQVKDLIDVERFYQSLPKYHSNTKLQQLAQATTTAYLAQEDAEASLLPLTERAAQFAIHTTSIVESIEQMPLDPIEMVHKMLNEEKGQAVLLQETYTQYGMACVEQTCTHIAAKREGMATPTLLN